MRELQYLKQVEAVPPIVVNTTTATVVNVIDTAGYDDMLVIFDFGVLGANLTAAKLQSSAAATQPGTFADVTGATLADLTSATNSDTTSFMYVNLRGHNRYFRPIVTTGAATDVVAVKCILFNPNGVLPKDAATRNVAQYLYVGSLTV